MSDVLFVSAFYADQANRGQTEVVNALEMLHSDDSTGSRTMSGKMISNYRSHDPDLRHPLGIRTSLISGTSLSYELSLVRLFESNPIDAVFLE